MVPPKVEADQSSSSYINNGNVNDELLSPQSIHSQKSKKQKISEGTPVSSSKFHRPSTSETTGRSVHFSLAKDPPFSKIFEVVFSYIFACSSVQPLCQLQRRAIL